MIGAVCGCSRGHFALIVDDDHADGVVVLLVAECGFGRAGVCGRRVRAAGEGRIRGNILKKQIDPVYKYSRLRLNQPPRNQSEVAVVRGWL